MNDFLSSTDRQQQIRQLVEQRERISITDVCALFGISQATARRDLEVLAGAGQVRRVHGGAIALRGAPPELPMPQRLDEQAAEKRAIGAAAAALVRKGETIFLGSGTTVLEVARALRERGGLSGLTVITNSLPVLNALSGSAHTLIGLGGMLRPSEMSFIGHITEQALAELRADKVFIGTRAISLEHGLTNEYLPETLTDRAILKAGREIILVADHSKINTVAAAFLAPLTAIHTFVTDARTPPDITKALQRAGMRVVQA